MVDAEQLCFQPAIDNIAMQLSCEYNKMHSNPYNPIVFNTHQIYLKDGANNWSFAKTRVAFAGKLVSIACHVSASV